MDDDRQYWIGWLTDPLARRLETIRQRVRLHYDAGAGHPQLKWFTPHGPEHCAAVEDNLHHLIPRSAHEQLTPDEKFFLLASAWLHDLGMIWGLSPDETGSAPDTVRELHHLRSEKYIANHYRELALEADEAPLFGLLALYHRRRCPIDRCEPDIWLSSHGHIRLRLLAAYLRLADALHVDVTRAPDDQYAISLTYDIPASAKLHWFRSMFVQSIYPDALNKQLAVCFKYPHFAPTDHSDTTLRMKRAVDGVHELVLADLSAELTSVRQVLVAGGISYFLDVTTKRMETELDDRLTWDIERVISERFLLENPSSSALFRFLLDSLTGILSAPDPAANVDSFLDDVEHKVLGSRRCHTGLRNLLEKLRSAWEGRDLERLRSCVTSEAGKCASNRELLSASAQEYLTRWLPESFGKSQPVTILLYGYSEQVIASLAGFHSALTERNLPHASGHTRAARQEEAERNAARQLRIFVCEGQPKNRVGWETESEYHDGIQYALKLADLGFPELHLIPDAIAGTLLAASSDVHPGPGPVDFVLLGANGFDDQSFLHSAGHAMVVACAEVAKRGASGPTVVLVATTDKRGQALPQESAAGPAPPDSVLIRDGWRFRNSFAGERVRTRMFVPHGPKLRRLLNEGAADVLFYNPREDRIPIGRVDVVLTEQGFRVRHGADWTETVTLPH